MMTPHIQNLVAIILGLAPVLVHAAPPPADFDRQHIDDIAIGYGVAIGEVDGDGKPDILLADQKQFVWYRNPGKPGEPWVRHVMVDKLTRRDNVCIAARDINGDGLVEVAVGAMWNPGNTTDPAQSGSVHYLLRPDDPTKLWTPVQLHHEPTVHRMRWIKAGEDRYQLVVLPLHGRGNRGGQGAGVRILAYDPPADLADASNPWKTNLINDTMHITHNLDTVQWDDDAAEELLVAGREGVTLFDRRDGAWRATRIGTDELGAGEVRAGRLASGGRVVAAVEPWHGENLVMYTSADDGWRRQIVVNTMKHGHALAWADVLGQGYDQAVVGWRFPNSDRKVGVKLLTPLDNAGQNWRTELIDDNKMAAEDLAVADLNGDGKPDIVAAGRLTKNLVIYWNRVD